MFLHLHADFGRNSNQPQETNTTVPKSNLSAIGMLFCQQTSEVLNMSYKRTLSEVANTDECH